MFGKKAQQRRAVRVLEEMQDAITDLMHQGITQTGDRLHAKLEELKGEYGETAPSEIAEPAHKALWTYNTTVECYEKGQYGAAEAGWMAVDAWLDGGEMIIPGNDQDVEGTS